MTLTVQVVIVGVSLFYLSAHASPINWLYAAPRALFDLAGSASASASSAVSPSSYIADLRSGDLKRKQEKFERLQNEKDQDQEELDTGNDKEDNGNGEGETEGNNEASPSFLEKKIGKILTKLRLIAQIKNAYHYKPEEHEHESNITFNITSVNHNTNPTNDTLKENIKEDLDIDPRFAKEHNVSEKMQPKVDVRLIKIRNQEPKESVKNTYQSENLKQEPFLAYGVPIKDPIIVKNKETLLEKAPLRIQLDVNQINNNLDDFDPPKSEKFKEQEPAKFGTLGVFFAELLGSVVGLAYGALAQFTNKGQSPVTVGTSEGL